MASTSARQETGKGKMWLYGKCEPRSRGAGLIPVSLVSFVLCWQHEMGVQVLIYSSTRDRPYSYCHIY